MPMLILHTTYANCSRFSSNSSSLNGGPSHAAAAQAASADKWGELAITMDSSLDASGTERRSERTGVQRSATNK